MENILLNEVGDIKLCDFGVSKRFKKGELLNERCGTPIYIPPEMFLEIPYDGTLSDVWSLGIVLYVMLYGNFPFQGDDLNLLKDKIVSARFPLRNTVSAAARKLVSRMLSKEPLQRPSVREMLADPWMQGMEDSGKWGVKVVSLFTEEEIQGIRSEYNFMERLEENSDASILTEHDLDSVENSFADNGAELSKSTILGPFNSLGNSSHSLLQGLDNSSRQKPVDGEFGFEKKIKFRPKLREVDRKYERNNNSKVDNGMYVKHSLKANEVLAKLARRKHKREAQKPTIGTHHNTPYR